MKKTRVALDYDILCHREICLDPDCEDNNSL